MALWIRATYATVQDSRSAATARQSVEHSSTAIRILAGPGTRDTERLVTRFD
jgi:hypothetical protein